LIRQASSHCTDSVVSNADPRLVSGDITVVRNDDGATEVKAAPTGSPNTAYHVFLNSVRQLGDLTTGDEGTGMQSFILHERIPHEHCRQRLRL
jgi:hypothetical protein